MKSILWLRLFIVCGQAISAEPLADCATFQRVRAFRKLALKLAPEPEGQ